MTRLTSKKIFGDYTGVLSGSCSTTPRARQSNKQNDPASPTKLEHEHSEYDSRSSNGSRHQYPIRPSSRNDLSDYTPNMERYYPMNNMDLDFEKYYHRPLGVQELMVYNIMQNYMFPRKIKPRILLDCPAKSSLVPATCPLHMGIKSSDRHLGLDIQTAGKILFTASPFDVDGNPPLTNEYRMLSLVQQYFFEVLDPTVKCYFHHVEEVHETMRNNGHWKSDMTEHLKSYRPYTMTQQRFVVFSGGLQNRGFGGWPGTSHHKYCIYPAFTVPAKGLSSAPRYLKLSLLDYLRQSKPRRRLFSSKGPDFAPCLFRGKPSRSSSESLKIWETAHFRCDAPMRNELCPSCGVVHVSRATWMVSFPLVPVSHLDKMTRRRSLSRTHINAMFGGPPKVGIGYGRRNNAEGTHRHPHCDNCLKTHRTKECQSRCGYCGHTGHKISHCALQPQNRCKCRPFPQYHSAADCPLLCSRRCGNPYPTGHAKHTNAMTCKHRCCMCGIRGHSGKECRFKNCRCGGEHLGQDCRWKIECPVEGCYRYLCGVHCIECGVEKIRGSGITFVGGRCPTCLTNGQPVGPKADERAE